MLATRLTEPLRRRQLHIWSALTYSDSFINILISIFWCVNRYCLGRRRKRGRPVGCLCGFFVFIRSSSLRSTTYLQLFVFLFCFGCIFPSTTKKTLIICVVKFEHADKFADQCCNRCRKNCRGSIGVAFEFQKRPTRRSFAETLSHYSLERGFCGCLKLNSRFYPILNLRSNTPLTCSLANTNISWRM